MRAFGTGGRGRGGSWRQACAAAVVVLVAAACPAAWADVYLVETAAFEGRDAAEALLGQLQEAGVEGQLVRTFRCGEGWVFVVRIEGLEGQELARERAGKLARLSGQAVRGFVVAGKDTLPVEDLSVFAPASAGSPGEGTAAIPGQEGGSEDAAQRGAELFAAVLLAHGGGATGQGAGGSASPWTQVHFRFERELTTSQGNLRVGHEVWRSGDAVRLEVRVLDGQGKDSVAAVAGDGSAWLQVEGVVHEVPAGPTREGLLAFCPEVVLEQALALRAWSPSHPAVLVEGPPDGAGLAWLDLDTGADGERLLLGVDPQDHRVRQMVVRDDAEIRWRFADYQELEGGPIVPLRTEVSADGSLRERITVRLLELAAPVDDDVFRAPP